MRLTTVLLPIVVLATLSGCSIVPYENEYACNMPDQLGKCQDMETSYKEAVTGVAENPPMKPASEQEEDEEENMQQLAPQSAPVAVANAGNAYDEYIDDYYSQLQRLIVEPKNPIIRQPTQMRLLILPYTSRDSSVMYMARHIYWVHKQPQFIMGDYMRKPAEILENPMMIQE